MIVPSVQRDELAAPQVKQDAPIEAFGGGKELERGIETGQKLLVGVGQFVRNERRKADDLAIKEAETVAATRRNERMWNPESGAFTKRGKDAFGVINEVGEAYEKDLDEIEKGLMNSEQKTLFRQIRMRQAGELNTALQRHTFEETRRYADEVTQSGLVNAQTDAVLNFHNPGKVAESLKTQRTLIESHAEDYGKGKEWIQENLSNSISQTHAGVINRMLANGQDESAEEYFKTVKEQITNKDLLVKAEQALAEGSREGQSFRIVDEYRKKGMSLTQMMKESRGIEDTKLRQAVNERAKSEFALSELAENDRNEQIYLKATNIIESGGSYDMIPPNERAQMPLQMRENLKNYWAKKAEGKQVVTDLSKYQEVKRMLTDPSRRDEALKYNLLQHINDIERPRLTQLIDEQAGLRKGDEKTMKVLDGYRTENQVVEAVMEQAFGTDVRAKAGTEKAKRIERARDSVDKAVENFAREHKRRPTNEELRKLANGQMLEVVTDTSWIFGDTKKRRFELEPGEEFEFEIPKADRDQIIKELNKRNRPVSDEEVLKWYLRGQGVK
jgi:hypothetical protein